MLPTIQCGDDVLAVPAVWPISVGDIVAMDVLAPTSFSICSDPKMAVNCTPDNPQGAGRLDCAGKTGTRADGLSTGGWLIHRVVALHTGTDGSAFYETRGDNNLGSELCYASALQTHLIVTGIIRGAYQPTVDVTTYNRLYDAYKNAQASLESYLASHCQWSASASRYRCPNQSLARANQLAQTRDAALQAYEDERDRLGF